jgi:hypothetical protein
MNLPFKGMLGHKMEGAMTTHNSAKSERERSDGNLDHRYGKIGISAVVAALRYPQQTSSRPAHSGRESQPRIAARG